jgi:1,4-dihydroxy-2-naphthoate polyprenyltransferase
MISLRQLFAITEMRTKLVSMSTFACASLYAYRSEGAFDLAALVLALPAVLLVDMGTTAFNSYFDYARGVDDAALLREPDKLLLSDEVTPGTVLAVGLGCFALAAFFGLALALQFGAWVAGAGALCLAVGFLYSGGAAPISRGPFGELFAGGFLGTALFMIIYRLQAGAWDWAVLAASLPGALAIASILSVNNACDIEGDRAAGRRTLAILLGPRLAAGIPAFILAFSFIAQVALASGGVLPGSSAIAAVIAALASIPILVGMGRRGFSHETKGRSMGGILKIFAIWSVGYLAALLF